MKIVVDIENTVTERNGKLHLDPFEPTNTLVMVGILTDTGEEYQIPLTMRTKKPQRMDIRQYKTCLTRQVLVSVTTLRMI